jgi:FkbM family methyltransferase
MLNFLRNLKRKIVAKRDNNRQWFIYRNHKVFFPKNSFIYNRIASGETFYEKDLVKILNRQLKDNSYCFDVGANIGLIAIPLLNYKKSLSVVSVEPSPKTLEYLKKTIDNSAYKNRWNVVGKAVADKTGTLEFFVAEEALGAFDSLKDTKRIPYANKVNVEVTTLDLIWKDLGKPYVSVIKIDIEGADLLALKGAVECIQTNKPFIVIEWRKVNVEAFGITEKDMIDFCNQIEYNIFGFPYMQRVETENEIRTFTDASDSLILISRHLY